MDKGYVYIGRLVDHQGNYLSDYYKMGKTTDFKTREISLNSTHLPIDVQFIRVFETGYMSGLEKILHACFDEYRVVKEYGWRRNITTEWFDVTDFDILSYKIDTVIKNFPSTSELDLIQKVMSDTGSTINQKVLTVNKLEETKKKWKLEVKINDEDISQKIASETMINFFSYVANKVGFEKLDSDEEYFSINKEELYVKFIQGTKFLPSSIKEFDGYYLFTGLSNIRKAEIINAIIKRYDLTEVQCNVYVLD
jgi:hypothetical protein